LKNQVHAFDFLDFDDSAWVGGVFPGCEAWVEDDRKSYVGGFSWICQKIADYF